jgi:hypothetical protein
MGRLGPLFRGYHSPGICLVFPLEVEEDDVVEDDEA